MYVILNRSIGHWLFHGVKWNFTDNHKIVVGLLVNSWREQIKFPYFRLGLHFKWLFCVCVCVLHHVKREGNMSNGGNVLYIHLNISVDIEINLSVAYMLKFKQAWYGYRGITVPVSVIDIDWWLHKREVRNLYVSHHIHIYVALHTTFRRNDAESCLADMWRHS